MGRDVPTGGRERGNGGAAHTAELPLPVLHLLQFDTVMAALGSNSERWGIFTIDLEFERPAAQDGSS